MIEFYIVQYVKLSIRPYQEHDRVLHCTICKTYNQTLPAALEFYIVKYIKLTIRLYHQHDRVLHRTICEIYNQTLPAA